MRRRITAATVNAELRRRGYVERLRQGRGYCYFTEGGSAGWFTSSVPVCYVSDLSVDRWIHELDLLRAAAQREGRL